MARRRGAKTVEINREPTPITPVVDWSLPGKAGEILPEVVKLTFGI
jgi:NAD-dependent deacetylase